MRLERGVWGLPTPQPRSKAKQSKERERERERERKREREREREEGVRLERGVWGLPTPQPRSKAKQSKERERERERESEREGGALRLHKTVGLAERYWTKMLDISRVTSLVRVKRRRNHALCVLLAVQSPWRCCTIMGREEGNLTAAQILYPLMQCTDSGIFSIRVPDPLQRPSHL